MNYEGAESHARILFKGFGFSALWMRRHVFMMIFEGSETRVWGGWD